MNVDLLDEIVSAAKQAGYCDMLGDDDRIKVEAEKKLSQLVCKAMTTIAERRCECGVWQADKYCGACGGLIDRGPK